MESEREIHHYHDGGGGDGTGTLAVVILVIVLVVLGFLLLRGGSEPDTLDVNVDAPTPGEVNLTE